MRTRDYCTALTVRMHQVACKSCVIALAARFRVPAFVQREGWIMGRWPCVSTKERVNRTILNLRCCCAHPSQVMIWQSANMSHPLLTLARCTGASTGFEKFLWYENIETKATRLLPSAGKVERVSKRMKRRSTSSENTETYLVRRTRALQPGASTGEKGRRYL